LLFFVKAHNVHMLYYSINSMPLQTMCSGITGPAEPPLLDQISTGTCLYYHSHSLTGITSSLTCFINPTHTLKYSDTLFNNQRIRL